MRFDFTEDRRRMQGTGAAGGGGGGSFSTSFSDINRGLFGEEAEQTQKGSTVTDTTTTESVDVDEEGILKMIDDILGGTEGLASIFGAEQAAGLGGSSVAKQGTEDLLSKIAGEIAKVTATKTSATKGTELTAGTAASESSGILDQLGGVGGLVNPVNSVVAAAGSLF